ncbi:MAG: hypothetical protein HY321_07515 [Armatimonadetes bacterium]|nr:hypothetical protein [Armatimonadota bacterium]
MRPILVPQRKRRRGGGRARRHLGGTLKRLCVTAAAVLLAGWLLMAALRPFLMDYQEVAELRKLEVKLAQAEVENEALRRRIGVLNTPKGIEVEARRLGWVRHGEILIQTSETPPSPPPAATPPLNAVRSREGLVNRAHRLASRTLARLRGSAPPGP